MMVFLLSLVGLGCGRSGPVAGKRPNLLLISIDTLRADRLGCYGYGRDTSPHIDVLAKEGVLFENAFSSSPKTTPSHMSIMTGLYPRVHNVYMWDQDKQGAYSGSILSENIPTLADILKEYGYTNVAFTGGANVAGNIGFGRSFEIYDEQADTEAACRWLKNNAEEPFFMFYHTYYTHDPYLAPQPYDKKYDHSYAGNIPLREELFKELGIREEEPLHGIWQVLHKRFWAKVDVNDPGDMQHISALYDGCVDYVDNEFIKSLIESLREKGVLDNTLVVLTSDHGEEFLEHGRLLHESLYGEVTRVPFIMRLPNVLPKGTRIQQLVRTVDIMPTILDLLGIPCEATVQGVSLLPAIKHDKELDLVAYADFNDYAPPVVESLRSGSWFYLLDQRQRGGASIPFTQMYNAERDPGEAADLAGSLPEVAGQLNTEMSALRIECSKMHEGKAADQETATMDQKNIDRLKALGYL